MYIRQHEHAYMHTCIHISLHICTYIQYTYTPPTKFDMMALSANHAWFGMNRGNARSLLRPVTCIDVCVCVCARALVLVSCVCFCMHVFANVMCTHACIETFVLVCLPTMAHTYYVIFPNTNVSMHCFTKVVSPFSFDALMKTSRCHGLKPPERWYISNDFLYLGCITLLLCILPCLPATKRK